MENGHIFSDKEDLSLSDYVKPQRNGRENLGAELPVAIYRLLEFSLREELTQRLGQEEQIEIFRGAGFRAGTAYRLHQAAIQRRGAQLLGHWRPGLPLPGGRTEQGRVRSRNGSGKER